MPWRGEKDPYKVLVSEVMLQQTQVSRVLVKYRVFLKTFPDFKALSEAKLSEVLKAWSGLGYNRRGKFLWQLARIIIVDYKGKLPNDPTELEKLPGIGKGTAGSIAAFAFNLPVTFIETNIRRVYIDHFFPRRNMVYDTELLPLIKATVDEKKPREWYYALMDYGAMLKEVQNPNKRSAHYLKQSPFRGSQREVRGAIIKFLTEKNRKTGKNKMIKELPFDKVKIENALQSLISEGFIKNNKGMVFLSE